jgi:hypothetical protein
MPLISRKQRDQKIHLNFAQIFKKVAKKCQKALFEAPQHQHIRNLKIRHTDKMWKTDYLGEIWPNKK